MHTDAGVTPFGSRLDRELVDLALSANDAALFSFRFAEDTVTWVSANMEALLDMPGAPESKVRARLRELIEPLTSAARQVPVWQELELQQPLMGDEHTRWIGFRARKVGEPGEPEGLVGLAADASSSRGDRQTLADLADRYRLLVELSPEAIAVHQGGVLKYANSATVSMLAAESDSQLVGHPITKFVSEQSLAEMWERLNSLTTPGQATHRAEAELVRLDGGTVPVEVISVRTSWEGRLAFQVILHDLTTQRQAEATLRYQAALVSHVSNAIIATTHEGVVTSWNPAAETVYGISADQAVGQDVETLIGAALKPETVLSQGGIEEAVHRRADGSALTIRVSAAEMDGGFVLVCADETARRRVEDDFATVVTMLGEGVIVVGANGRIKWANPAAQRILGVSETDLVGTVPTSWAVFEETGERLPTEAYPWKRAQRTGQPTYSTVVRFPRPDGESVWLKCTTRALTPEDEPPHSVVLSFTDVTEQRRHHEILRYQATHDELTGLLNRKGINDLLAELLRREQGPDPGNPQVGVVFCDIDNFKRINDSLGHEAGDELLTVLAQRLCTRLSQQCQAGRLSGDEFVVLCSDVEAYGGLEALLLQVSEILRTVVSVREQLVRVSASAGAAMLDRSMTGEDLMRYADAAMFHAKGKGPGRAAVADPALLTSAKGQLLLEEQLREAIDRDELALHYQPILARDGSVSIAEALLRWPHPERGMLSPGVILPVAEQGGMLRDLDRWVLRTALRQAADWPSQGTDPTAVAVNLGGLAPDDPGFVDEVLATIRDNGLRGHHVVLEMVETALVNLSHQAREAMTRLAEHGVRFAVDDFGTGYSSLTRLKDLPAQILKLDRRFVSNLENDSRDRAVARAVVDMGHAMGHRCIAEGIETGQQFQLLNELGIDLYQGFLLSYPLPAKEFHSQLESMAIRTPQPAPYSIFAARKSEKFGRSR